MNEIDTYLAHHGIKGQKWGVRRYQNADGTLTAEGRKRAGLGPEKKESTAKKIVAAAKQRSAKRKEASAKKKEASKEEEHENLKKAIRKHPELAYKHRTELTSDDVKEIAANFEMDKKLRDIRDQQIKNGWNKVSQFANNASTIANILDTSKRIYNATTEVHNTLIDAGQLKGEKRLKIGEKPEEKKEDRSYFENLVKNGTTADILREAPRMTTQELNDYWKRSNVISSLNKANDTAYEPRRKELTEKVTKAATGKKLDDIVKFNSELSDIRLSKTLDKTWTDQNQRDYETVYAALKAMQYDSEKGYH